MYVGIGCAALVFLSCVCGGGVYLFVSSRAEAGLESLRDYQVPVDPAADPSSDPMLGSKPDQPFGSGVAEPTAGGETCAKIDRCCPAFYVARGLGADQAASTCGQMAAARAQAAGPMLETICAAQLQAFASAGGGVPLPPECQ